MAGPQERCRIALWRGYVSALFYARPVERDVAMLLSPAFRTRQAPWRRRVPLRDDPAANEALHALAEMLAAQGWTRARVRDLGADWYDLQFRRNGRAGPVERSEQVDDVPVRGRRARPGQRGGAAPRATRTSISLQQGENPSRAGVTRAARGQAAPPSPYPIRGTSVGRAVRSSARRSPPASR